MVKRLAEWPTIVKIVKITLSHVELQVTLLRRYRFERLAGNTN